MDNMVRKNTPTLKTIAEQAGVTQNTVSLALRDSHLVAKETKRVILKVAREQGYVRNDVANSLRSGRTHTIAIIFGDIGNMLFAIKIAELEKALRKRHYQVLILNSGEDAALEYSVVETAIRKKVDGVILCPCQEDRASLELMRKRGIPYVLIGRCFPEHAEDAVLWDDYQGGYIATRHLIDRGCSRILMLNVSCRISSAVERRNGYLDALMEAGLEPIEREVSLTNVDVNEALRGLADKPGFIDGIFAFSDLIAFHAACWCLEQGVRIPEDMLLIGFDDILSHVQIPFPLSSICADKTLETETAVDILLKRVEAAESLANCIVRMPVQLIPRHSTAGLGHDDQESKTFPGGNDI